MPDHFHTQETHSGSKDAGCCPADENHVPKSKTIPEFPEVKLSFSVSGILLFLLVCYKKTISPWLPECCRFTPTCSAYAAEAIMVHGPLKGVLLAAGRLLRCQPFCKGGYDPVPPRKKLNKENRNRETL